MFFDRHRGWRTAKATQNKKADDFAQCMKDLVDIHYPDAHKIHVVMDNYSTHKAGSLYKAFAPDVYLGEKYAMDSSTDSALLALWLHIHKRLR